MFKLNPKRPLPFVTVVYKNQEGLEVVDTRFDLCDLNLILQKLQAREDDFKLFKNGSLTQFSTAEEARKHLMGALP